MITSASKQRCSNAERQSQTESPPPLHTLSKAPRAPVTHIPFTCVYNEQERRQEENKENHILLLQSTVRENKQLSVNQYASQPVRDSDGRTQPAHQPACQPASQPPDQEVPTRQNLTQPQSMTINKVKIQLKGVKNNSEVITILEPVRIKGHAWSLQYMSQVMES